MAALYIDLIREAKMNNFYLFLCGFLFGVGFSLTANYIVKQFIVNKEVERVVGILEGMMRKEKR